MADRESDVGTQGSLGDRLKLTMVNVMKHLYEVVAQTRVVAATVLSNVENVKLLRGEGQNCPALSAEALDACSRAVFHADITFAEAQELEIIGDIFRQKFVRGGIEKDVEASVAAEVEALYSYYGEHRGRPWYFEET